MQYVFVFCIQLMRIGDALYVWRSTAIRSRSTQQHFVYVNIRNKDVKVNLK